MTGMRAIQSEANLASLPGSTAPAPPAALGPGTALMLVDLQPVYWTECEPARENFPHLPENVAALLAAARDSGAEVVHVRAAYSREQCPWLPQFERLNPGRKQYEVDPRATEPWASPLPGETTVDKDTFGAFVNAPDLTPDLRAKGVHTIIVCGLITSVCVQHTVFGAFNAGFRVAVAEDACGDRSVERHKAAISLYGGYMYEVVQTADVVSRTLAGSRGDAFQNAPCPELSGKLSHALAMRRVGGRLSKPGMSPDTHLGVSLSQVSLLDYCQLATEPHSKHAAAEPALADASGLACSMPTGKNHLHDPATLCFKQHMLLDAGGVGRAADL